MTDNDWIKPGAEVVAYTTGTGTPTVHKTTVATVATKSFTVVGLGARIKLDGLRSADQGDSWHSWRWQIVRPDDPIVTKLAEQRLMARLAADAFRAVRKWSTGDFRANVTQIDAAITALQAYRAALVGEGEQ